MQKLYPKQYSKWQKVYPKISFHRVLILIQPGNQAVFTPLQTGLNFDLTKFYDRNKYQPLANDNPKQFLES